MNDSFERQSLVSWAKQAARFLTFGYRIVPIKAMSGVPQEVEDPVVKHLGAEPLVDPVDGAASTETEIEELGERFEEARIGVLTGPESDLLAIERKKGDIEHSDFYERIASFAKGTASIVSSTREYVLFPYPRVERSLPPITEKNGAVLHGDGSVIFLPGNGFEWKDRFSDENGEPPRRNERRENARGLLSLFGLEGRLAPKEKSPSGDPDRYPETDRCPDSNPETVLEKPSQLDSPLDKRHTNGHSTSTDSDIPFRSGSDLRHRAKRGGGRLNLPWTIPGGLSVLTGPPKTAGKSSWVVNLAVHLVAGEPFLAYENPSSEVVLLADTPPPALRKLLAQFHFLDDEALRRLHVLHPSDVKSRDWLTTLLQAYEHAGTVGADLLIVDCLDRYIRLKGGPSPTESEDVSHTLTAESPPECPILSVKNTNCSAEEAMSQTIERLGILGLSADAVLRLDNVSTDRFPSLRRVVTVGGQSQVSQTHVCALRAERYVRVRREPPTGPSRKEVLSEPTLSNGTTAVGAEPDPPAAPRVTRSSQ